MTLLVVILLMTAAVLCLRGMTGTDRAAFDGSDVVRLAVVTLVMLLPILYATLVLFQSRDRLDTLRLTYSGKRLAFGPDIPVTAGSSPPDSDAYEDLHAPNLGPGALTIRPADAQISGERDDIEIGDPLIHLSSPSPIVRVDGVAWNSYPLASGDRIVLKSGGEAVELFYQDGVLGYGGRSLALPGSFKLLLKGTGQVFYLPDLLAELAPERPAGASFRSVIHRPAARGPWHLLIRDDNVEIVRGQAVAARFESILAVPRDFELRLQIVWGKVGVRHLRTMRQDRLIFRRAGDGEHVEVRFGDPQRRIVPLGDSDSAFELGLVVPHTIDRRDELIELDDASPRFRGLSASLFYDPKKGEAGIGFLSDRIAVESGELFALGEGTDQMLVRLERTPFPSFILFDLALMTLYIAVFLGRYLLRSTALLAVVAPVGLLLASRLLFAYRAAQNPPHFFVTGYGEARLALWLVPAAILLGWTLAWLIRSPKAGGQKWSKALKWPLLGLGTAGLGCLASTSGAGNLPWLGLAPWLAAGGLVLVYLLFGKPTMNERRSRWQNDGWFWRYRWLLICAVLVVVVRGLAAAAGMQETLRLPSIGFRLLWTVLQLPLCAGVFALTLHLVDERRQQVTGASGNLRGLIRHWLAGVCTLGLFMAAAFLLVALIANDTGLVIAHSLPAVFGLLFLLVSWPPGLRRSHGKAKAAYAAGIVLVCLPLLTMVSLNVVPEKVVDLAYRVTGGDDTGEELEEVIDRRAQLLSIRSQRLFRLYMLGNPAELQELGIQPSERVAIHYHTLQSYADEAGFMGAGFASSRLPRHLGITYLSDLVPMVFVLADFGVVGLFALALVYAASLIAIGFGFAGGSPGGRLGSQGTWIASIALLAFALPSLYMILANLNLVLFTGKNCNLLSLNSVSDVLESAGLLALATFGLGLRRSS